MLGKCYEHGLGVEIDQVLAKDFYKCALKKLRFIFYSQDYEMLIWLKSKIAESRPLYEELSIAKVYSFNTNKNWICDGYTRFYDGYTLNSYFFSLVVKRGETSEYKSIINGRDCTVIFPYDADLGYLYVQGTIMNKVLDLLRKRANVVIPQKLNELSQRMGIPYGKCKISKNMRRAWDECFYETRNIHISFRRIRMPEEYLEAICAHELTHCLFPNHEGKFWQTFKERAGEYLVSLDVKLGLGHIPYRWQPIKWN